MTATEIGYHLYGNEDDPSEHSNDIDDLDNIKSVGTKDSEDDVDYVEISSGSPTDTDDESCEEGNENEVAEKPSSSSRKNRRKSYSDKEYVAHANAIESRFTSKYPFFRVILQTSYMKSRYMPIPCAIKRLYFPDDVKDVKIKASDGRLWKIAVLHLGKDNMRFCKGVTDLINKKNGLNLKVGDVLIFEIVKKGCLKVNVFRYKRDA
ncbi:hypothetical protein MKW94_005877 [Papaver nudicaule]|uniref:TF-B3 domain-containing protein n=1 Tax=Papaver nudicaule TaxID=74823 RepID=A0AA41RYG8_PAPNU|nr:hypothetical protein [Papaver nudicaule]